MKKLKCSKCKAVYPDNKTTGACESCGNELRRITVHDLKPKSMEVTLKPIIRREK